MRAETGEGNFTTEPRRTLRKTPRKRAAIIMPPSPRFLCVLSASAVKRNLARLRRRLEFGRALILLSLAAVVWADSALEVHDLFENAAHALDDGHPAGFMNAFDPSTPGIAKLRTDVAELTRINDVRSTIDWAANEGDDQSRTVKLNWLLDISERGGASAVTRRRVQVECRLNKKNDAWRIVSFTPPGFFAVAHGGDAWNVVMTAALGLTEAAADNSTENGGGPTANAKKFMQAFDPAMPGYAQLQDSLISLEQSGDVESSVDLLKNEGDDAVRTIVVDWSLNLISQDTKVEALRRRETVTCTLEKRGKNWRITGIDPRTLFAPRK
jgi:hypothetical protein